MEGLEVCTIQYWDARSCKHGCRVASLFDVDVNVDAEVNVDVDVDADVADVDVDVDLDLVQLDQE